MQLRNCDAILLYMLQDMVTKDYVECSILERKMHQIQLNPTDTPLQVSVNINNIWKRSQKHAEVALRCDV